MEEADWSGDELSSAKIGKAFSIVERGRVPIEDSKSVLIPDDADSYLEKY